MQALALTTIILGALIIVYLLGPRVSLDTQLLPAAELPDSPAALAHWLQRSEAQFNDLIPGTEKTIIWANPQHPQRTRRVLVYLHGFSASRQETAPVTDQIAQELGANLFYARLRSHGRGATAMAEASVNRWVNDAAEAMQIARRLGDEIILVGCSTGATLAWWTSFQTAFHDDIQALVLFSPNFGVRDKRSPILLMPWGEQITRAIIGASRSFTPVNEAQATYWTPSYPTQALLPMMGMVKVATQYPAAEQDIPTFMLYSNLDDTVDAEQITHAFDALTVTKKRLIIDNPQSLSHHIIVGDILAPENNQVVIQAVLQFLNSTSPS